MIFLINRWTSCIKSGYSYDNKDSNCINVVVGYVTVNMHIRKWIRSSPVVNSNQVRKGMMHKQTWSSHNIVCACALCHKNGWRAYEAKAVNLQHFRTHWGLCSQWNLPFNTYTAMYKHLFSTVKMTADNRNHGDWWHSVALAFQCALWKHSSLLHFPVD